LALLLIVISFVTPWYRVSFEFESSNTTTCQVSYLIQWNKVFCSEIGCDQIDPTHGYCPNDFNWRESITPQPVQTEGIYNFTAGFLGGALLSTFILWIINVLFVSHVGRNTLTRLLFILFGTLAIFCIMVALLVFGARLPSALENDMWLCNIAMVEQIMNGPCYRFIGSTTFPYTPWGDLFSISWGGVGYWVAFCATFPLIVTIFLALPKFKADKLRTPIGLRDERVEVSG